jgi:hypothetical protein
MLHIQDYWHFISEQEKFSLDPKQLPQKSDRLGKGGSFETSLYGNKTKEEYFKILKAKDPKTIKRIRLIFPGNNWEVIALKLVKTLGVVTGVFTNIETANRFINGLVSKGVTADELVIGSHGQYGQLLSPKQGDSYYFDNSFLKSFKPLVHKGTKVFFTACHGADYLDSLKDASEKLGVPVYGSAGIYNYITNASEKGFYLCFPAKFETGKEKSISAVYLDSETNGYRITWKEGDTQGVTGEKVRVTLDPSIFGIKLAPITIGTQPINIETARTSEVRAANSVMRVDVDLLQELEKSMYTDPAIYAKFKAKLNRMPGNDKWDKQVALQKSLIDNFNKGLVKIEISKASNWVNIKTLKDVTFYKEIDNQYLLNHGLCKRYDNPPVSWLD